MDPIIGNNIKRLREINNMSQDELADKLYCTRQTISNYERGISEPDIDTIKKIAVLFNSDIKDIIEQSQKKDYKPIIKSFIKTLVILTFSLLLYLISLKLFNKYFNNALLLCGIAVIPFAMYCIGLFIGDLLCLFNHEIKNKKFKKYLRTALIIFIMIDVLVLAPAFCYNLYVLFSKLFIEGDLSFSFISNNIYSQLSYIFMILNASYKWIFIFVGLGMRMSKRE